MRSYQQFFAELKRRHVFKVAAIYGAVAFGVLQVAEPLGTALGLSDSFLSLVVGLLLLGFPVALVLAWAFEVTPDGVQKAEPAAPGEIEAIVAQPASRRWPAGLLALAGAALLFGGWWMGRSTAADAGRDAAAESTASEARLAFTDLADDTRPSIAVLPFTDMSPESDQEHFSDGMTEEIINVLARTGQFGVRGRTSAFAYKGENRDLREIGSELNVAYLIEGSVRKDGDQLRITAQLIDAADDSHLWSESYTRPAANIFDVQIEIAEAIAAALQVPLGLDDHGDLVTPTADIEAYDLYLAGRSRLRERGQGIAEAAELFEAAIARDSAWAPAWAGLADATELQLWNPRRDIPFEATLAEAERGAKRALELQPNNSTALVVLGSVHRDRYEWADAEASYRRALAVDPDNPEAHQQYGELLHKMGRLQEAVRSLDRAAALDPAAVRVGQLMYVLQRDDRWDDADAVLRWAATQGIDLTFGGLFADADEFWRSTRAWEEGRYEDAAGITPGWGPGDADSLTRAAAIPALRAGRFDLLPDSLKDADWGYAELVRFGERERAVAEFLEHRRVGQAGGSPLVRLTPEEVWWPVLDPIRSHPSIQAYLESIGLGGRTVQRTPVQERVRPAILRRADIVAGSESTEESAP
jgi:TolB-like protein